MGHFSLLNHPVGIFESMDPRKNTASAPRAPRNSDFQIESLALSVAKQYTIGLEKENRMMREDLRRRAANNDSLQKKVKDLQELREHYKTMACTNDRRSRAFEDLYEAEAKLARDARAKTLVLEGEATMNDLECAKLKEERDAWKKKADLANDILSDIKKECARCPAADISPSKKRTRAPRDDTIDERVELDMSDCDLELPRKRTRKEY